MARFISPLSLLAFIVVLSCAGSASAACFDAIFSFGASKVDTGNLIRTSYGKGSEVTRYPYGRTYFLRPTGRFCDGRLTVDFFAQASGLPLLRPYLAGVGSVKEFGRGVNFAVAGGTALDKAFYDKRNITIQHPYSLSVQAGWFKGLVSSLCPSGSACKDIVAKSLFLVGEIGGNDYNYQFFQGKPVEEIEKIIPFVVQKTGSVITDLIGYGAKTVLVPGNYPMGCISFYLSTFQTNKSEDYDSRTGCIKWLNEFSANHNLQLQNELKRLRQLHPDTTIIYADYYNPLISIFHVPHRFGFAKTTAFDTCCGGVGPYNFNTTVRCGDPGQIVCRRNSKPLNWDGIHITEAAYKIIASNLLKGPLASLPIGKNCLPHGPEWLTYP